MQKLYDACVLAGQLSSEDNLLVYRQHGIFERANLNALPQQHPTAIILGGQNASGKSTLGEQFVKEYQNTGIVRIDGDSLRRYHPNFKKYNAENDKLTAAYTAKDSGVWTRRLIEEAGKNSFNMLIETTLRSPDVVSETVNRLTAGGYNVRAEIFVVCYDKSLLGCYKRYEMMKARGGFGRFVHDHALKAAYNGMPETLQRLQQEKKCSSIRLYTREQVLFQGDYRTTDIIDIVQQERRREFTLDEIKFLQSGWKDVGEKMTARKANPEEFQEVLRRLKERANSMIKAKYPITNSDAIINISSDFSKSFA
jgi:predicted ABC-type ATPase